MTLHVPRAAGPAAWAACALLFWTTAARATVTYNVIFDDPTNSYTSYYADIESSVLGAGAQWSTYLEGSSTLDVLIRFNDSIPTATGGSLWSSYYGSAGGYSIWEQGAAAKARDGTDGNGAAPDVLFTIGTSYLANELWFDPDPISRSATVPINRTDAVSVFMHEFGHALGFNGWRNRIDGTLPSDYMSTFDAHVIRDGADFFFNGPLASALYGGPVPLTTGNIMHLGNWDPRPGSDLLMDLMNGVVYYRGTRYDISALDLAILADVGVSLRDSPPGVIPEPSTWLAWCIASVPVAVGAARRRARRDAA